MPGKNLHPSKGKRSDKIATTKQRIIVMGASTGGFEAIKKIIKKLPPDFDASIFIVWHLSPEVRGILPQVLNSVNSIVAAHASDNETILPNRIYVAPADHHLLVEDGRMRVTRGPRENRFRPAIDPLFRSAAYAYGKRVIGVILTGALDDGTAGLWTVKQYGGTTIVQDPADAEVPSMPEHALREVRVDYCVTVPEIADLLVRLSKQPLGQTSPVMKDAQTKKEIDIAAEENSLKNAWLYTGELTPFSCPECHGVLSRLQNDHIVRYRCHSGHAYSADTLMEALNEKIDDGLYHVIRGMEEKIMLLNHFGDHYAEANQPRLAAIYFTKAKEAKEQLALMRKLALSNERFGKDAVQKDAENQHMADYLKIVSK